MDYTKFFDPDILEMVGQARKEVQKKTAPHENKIKQQCDGRFYCRVTDSNGTRRKARKETIHAG